MKREEFLSTFGIGLAAVCAGTCFSGCGKGETGDPGGGTNPPSGVSFTVNLTTEITAVGQSITNSGVIVVRLATGTALSSFTAVQLACTHEGTSIGYSTTEGKFICTNHGSKFSTSGTVLNLPATKNLKVYTMAISGTTMTVTG